MTDEISKIEAFRFGEFVFSLKPLKLVKNGRNVGLRNRALRLLGLLIERRGELVTHDEIKVALWPDREVDVPRGVHVCVGEIRQTLQDNPDRPSFVETLPRQGYRFICPVEPLTKGSAPEPGKSRGPLSRAVPIAPYLMLAITLGAIYLFQTQSTHTRKNPQRLATAAEEAYQKGAFLLDKGVYENFDQTAEYFAEAISRDSNFALAYLGLSEIEIRRGNFDLARNQVQKALAADPSEPLIHLHLGRIAMWGQWDWTTARRELNSYLASAPNSAKGHMLLAWLNVIQGRSTEALEEANLAYRLDPVSSLVLAGYGQVHYFTGDYQTALKYCGEATTLESPAKEIRLPPLVDQSYRCVLMSAIQLGRQDIAKAAAAQLSEMTMKDAALAEHILNSPLQEGLNSYFIKTREFTRLLSEQDNRLEAALAELHISLGDDENALKSLSLGLENHYALMPLLIRDPIFSALRPDPEYQSVLRQLNLQAAPEIETNSPGSPQD